MMEVQIGGNHIDLDNVTGVLMRESGLELQMRNPEDGRETVLTFGQPEHIDRVLEVLGERRPEIPVRSE